LLMDAYLPAGPGPFPGVILIHGGAWKSGSRQDESKVASLLASDGFAAFAVDYRLVSPYPAALHDVEDAVLFIRRHAQEYSLDASRVGAMGFSAGGELAALLGTLGRGDVGAGFRVAAVATWSGPMDLESLLDGGDANIVPLVTAYLGCEPSPRCDLVAHAASPINHIDPTDAPMYLVNSADEIMPLEQATSMKKALEQDGVAADVTVVPGSEHVPLSETTIAGAVSFFTKVFGSGAGVSQTPRAQPDPSLGPGKGGADRGTVTRPGGGSSVVVLVIASVLAAVAGALGYAIWSRRRFRYLGTSR
jgi:acetyl esterase/lipase